MPRKPAPTIPVRTTVPVETGDRLQRMADALGISLPNLLRFMISTQLVQWEAMYLHPEQFVDAAKKVGGRAGAAMADRLAREAVDLTGSVEPEPKRDAPGFHPPGKPRSFHDEELVTHGSEWTGYMRGL